MLKKRIIPKLLLKYQKYDNKIHPVFVTTKNYNHINFVGDPISQGKIFEAQLADELILLNFERINIENNTNYYNFLKEFSSNVFLPLTIGGGIKKISDIEKHLKNGADKVVVNTSTAENKNLIDEASKIFGKQCIVVSIDFKLDNNKKMKVFINRGKTNINIDPISWSKQVQDMGAGEVILSDIDKDGTKKGLNIEIGKKISETLEIPVILTGGCGLADHFVQGFLQTKIQGISAGTFFSYRDQNFFQARSQVLNNNILLR